MGNNTLHFYFNETINRSSLTFTDLQLHSQPFDPLNPDTPFNISFMGNITNITYDGTDIEIALSPNDYNYLKQYPLLFRSRASSYISFTEDFIYDMLHNPVAAVSYFEAASYITDNVSPYLVLLASVNMNSSTIVIFKDQ